MDDDAAHSIPDEERPTSAAAPSWYTNGSSDGVATHADAATAADVTETAQAEPAEPVAPDPDAAFLSALAEAMKSAAGIERSKVIEDTERRRADHIASIHARRDNEADRIRELAEEDRKSIDAWAEAEAQRIQRERDRRSAALNEDLDKSLAEHRTRIDWEIQRVEAAISTYRTEVDAFFASLEKESDPVAIAQHAIHRPAFPALDALTAVPATTSEPAPVAEPAAIAESAPIEAPAAQAIEAPPAQAVEAPPAQAVEAPPAQAVELPTWRPVEAPAPAEAPMFEAPAAHAADAPAAADAEAVETETAESEPVAAFAASTEVPEPAVDWTAPVAEETPAEDLVAAAPAEESHAETFAPVAQTEAVAPAAEPGLAEPVAEAAPIEPVAEAEVGEPVMAARSIEAEATVGETAIFEAPVAELAAAEPVAEAAAAEPAADAGTAEPISDADVAAPVADADVAQPAADEEISQPVAQTPVVPVIDRSPEMTGIGVMEPLSASKLAEAWAAWNRSTQAADAQAEAQAASEAETSAAEEAVAEVQSTPAGAYVEPAEPVGAASGSESRSGGPFSSGPGFSRMSWLRRDKDRNAND